MGFGISKASCAISRSHPEVQAAALSLLHARVPAALAAGLVNSSLVVCVFIDAVATQKLMVWYGLNTFAVVVGGALWFHNRNQSETGWIHRWRRTVVIFFGVGGVLWGMAGVLFFLPDSPIHFTVLAFVLGGMAAGALAILSVHLPTFHAYVLPSLLPFCARLTFEGETASLAMAAMFLMYIVAVVVVAPKTHAALAQTFALRLENRALLQGLERRVRDRTRRQASVVDFSQRALSGLETDTLLREAACIVAAGLPATCAAVMELLPDSDLLAVRATAGWKDDVILQANVPAGPESLSGYTLRTGEPTVCHDPLNETRFEIPRVLRERGVRSIIVVPIWGDRAYYGTLEAWNTEPRTIGADDVHFVRAVATTIAAASQRRQSEEHGQRLALHDPLTGLPNRALFRDFLSQAMSRTKRSGELLALLLIDLDHFKDVNDSLGHPAGDMLLAEVGQRLRGCVREAEPPARLGGDEFAVILSGLVTPDGAATVAEKIFTFLGKPYRLDGHDLYIGVSIGITIYPHDGGDPDSLLCNADLALYRAKERGRNTYQFYSADLASSVEMRMELLRDLRLAIEGNQMELAYQPQVALRDGRVTGVEALLRWRSTRRGLVLPGEFIPFAEASGLIIPLEDWTIRQACVQGRRWREAGLPRVLIAVNLSLSQWRRRNMPAAIERILEHYEYDPRCLELEITERVFPLPDEIDFLEDIGHLRRQGISISIDDFGTGHSNLQRLLELPVDRIKIDRSFVGGIGCRVNAEKIARAIIVLGRSLGVKVVAEGVEQALQIDFLRSEGCDFAQGYYFGRPMRSNELVAWMAGTNMETMVS
jgi:diguanylate cyclase (GGDEF)-like protein